MNSPRLRLASLQDDKPVRVTVQLPAEVHRDLSAYAELLRREGDLAVDDPAKLIPHMLKRFMATDRAFTKFRRTISQESKG